MGSHKSTEELREGRREAGGFSGMRKNQNTKAERQESTVERASKGSEVEWSPPSTAHVASLLGLPVALTGSAKGRNVILLVAIC